MMRTLVAKTKGIVLLTFALAAFGLVGCSNAGENSVNTLPKTVTSTSSTVETPEKTPVTKENPDTQKSISVTKRPKVLRLEQIKLGNYDSLEGTWGSKEGGTLKVQGSTIYWTTARGPFAKIEKTHYRQFGDPVTKYGLGLDEVAWSLTMQWSGQPDNKKMAPYVGSALVFYPAGVPLDLEAITGNSEIIPSDTSRARILALPGNGVGRLFPDYFEDYVMYRDGDSLNVKLETGLDAANCKAPVSGAYPCAGKAVPANARSLPSLPSGKESAVRTPSGNITCEVERDNISCMVGSWKPEMNPNYVEPQGGIVTIYIPANGPAAMGQKSDAPNYANYGNPILRPITLPYGTIWHYGNIVIASEQNGLTIWNSRTGYGTFLNRSGHSDFKR
ncbi:hypothetical protein KRX54_07270 [Actinomycetaceae bacterium TAE3-ERU4]|nr:hypothetical protein [Actinomycetaceae bacterium TAE3-ERU4]